MVAPRRPPIKAWEELVGIPFHQLNKSQRIAPVSAAMMTYWGGVISTKPLLMVLATFSLTKAPIKFMVDAKMIALRGVRALV